MPIPLHSFPPGPILDLSSRLSHLTLDVRTLIVSFPAVPLAYLYSESCAPRARHSTDKRTPSLIIAAVSHTRDSLGTGLISPPVLPSAVLQLSVPALPLASCLQTVEPSPSIL